MEPVGAILQWLIPYPSKAAVMGYALTRRQLLMTGVATVSLATARDGFSADLGISHAADAIHQEPVFAVSRERVYRVLTQSAQFDRLTAYSDAVTSGAVKNSPARIDARPGGSFALFGGYISGRFLDLVPNTLIVQAWRAGTWQPGIYSVARFELINKPGGTRISFDHTGFPKGQAQHLAKGWYANYWIPLAKVLARP